METEPIREAMISAAHTRWEYQSDENPKRKHHWEKDHPGFVEVPRRKSRGSVRVGKCPSKLAPSEENRELLNRLLNSGIPWFPSNWVHEHPKRIYIVHNGWLYRATPTVAGRSYHAFPEDYQQRRVPPKIHTSIREEAERLGCAREIERWLGNN